MNRDEMHRYSETICALPANISRPYKLKPSMRASWLFAAIIISRFFSLFFLNTDALVRALKISTLLWSDYCFQENAKGTTDARTDTIIYK